MDVIIFNDFSLYPGLERTMGGYRVANSWRKTTEKVVVIDQLRWILDHHYDRLIDYLGRNIDSDTKFVGFSSTFMKMFDHDEYHISYLRPQQITNEVTPKLVSLVEFVKSKKVAVVLGGFGIESTKIWDTGLFDHWVKDTVYDIHNCTPSFQSSDGFLIGETLPLELSKGCMFKCKFCSHRLLGRKVTDNYIRSEDSIYDELMNNYDNFGVTNYNILCDTFNESTNKLLSVQRAMKRTGINFTFVCYLRIELVHKFPEQISILRDIGIQGAHFGLESLHYPSAKSIGKGLAKDKIYRTLEHCKESWGEDSVLRSTFIIGLPHDTEQTVDDWCTELFCGETPLDTWDVYGLILRDKEDKNPFVSEFSREPEKYGYITGPQGKWKNEHWTYESAQKLAKKWSNRFYKADCMTQQIWFLNSLIGLGYRWKDLARKKRREFLIGPFRDEYVNKAANMKDIYVERILR